MTQSTTRTDIVHSSRALYIAMDLGRDSWQLAISDGGKTIREVKVVRKDVDVAKTEFMTEVAKARVKFSLDADAPVHALYEAGRDGFWIARWLESVGIPCLVIDPCSILVDRKAKQRKNDAIDARALLDLLVRHVTGDREVSIVAVPPGEIDDQRELGRVIRKLGRTRRSLANRVRSVLWRYGIDDGYRADLAKKFPEMRTGDGQPLGPVTRLELETLCGQILGLDTDLQRLEDERVAQLKKPVTRAQEQARAAAQAHAQPIGGQQLVGEVGGLAERFERQLRAFVGRMAVGLEAGRGFIQMGRELGAHVQSQFGIVGQTGRDGIEIGFEAGMSVHGASGAGWLRDARGEQDGVHGRRDRGPFLYVAGQGGVAFAGDAVVLALPAAVGFAPFAA